MFPIRCIWIVHKREVLKEIVYKVDFCKNLRALLVKKLTLNQYKPVMKRRYRFINVLPNNWTRHSLEIQRLICINPESYLDKRLQLWDSTKLSNLLSIQSLQIRTPLHVSNLPYHKDLNIPSIRDVIEVL